MCSTPRTTPTISSGSGSPVSKRVAVLGAGMHPWGKWGRNFVEYGVHAARAALADSGIDWQDVDLVVGGETVRNGYGGGGAPAPPPPAPPGDTARGAAADPAPPPPPPRPGHP